MKQPTADIFVQANKSRAANVEPISADKSKIPDSVSKSKLAASNTMIDEYRFNCETYLQEFSQLVDDLFPCHESDSTMSVQVFIGQKDLSNLHLEDSVTILHDVTLAAPCSNNVVLADEIHRIVE